jgi:hypothetical protein
MPMQYMTQRVYCSSWGSRVPARPTTLLDLARTLLDRARDDIKERVPIVLNLSNWKTKQPLAEWISSELSEKYRVPRKMARFWLRHDYLLPLLDGLDEIETSMQPNCVAAINAFIEELKLSGLVVCCRLNEYRWLPERLKLNGAICLEPLSSEEVSKYLAEGGPTLEALREAVNTDTVLHELTQIPLMLSIMSLAYQGADGNELARQEGNSTEEQRRNQIFGLYVEKMFQRKGTISLVFPKEKTISWLSWLARNMREHSQSVFLVEGLQPIWLGTRAKRLAQSTVIILSKVAVMFVPKQRHHPHPADRAIVPTADHHPGYHVWHVWSSTAIRVSATRDIWPASSPSAARSNSDLRTSPSGQMSDNFQFARHPSTI